MANPKGNPGNLRVPSSNEARKNGRKGGIKSGEVRRQLRTFQQLDAEITTDEERAAMLNVLKNKAIEGDTRAWEIYAQYMGMKPTDKVDVRATSTFEDAIDELIGRKTK